MLEKHFMHENMIFLCVEISKTSNRSLRLPKITLDVNDAIYGFTDT